MSEHHPWVILFDIDGTLLTVDRNFNRPLLREILDGLHINYPQMESDPFSGRTDHDIFSSFLVNHNNDPNLYLKFKETYLAKLEEQIKPEHIIRHNHIDEALEYFSNRDFITGLLTGNYPAAATIKLKTANIHYDFSIGAFGEFDLDRNKLPLLAMNIIEEDYGIVPDPSKFVIIGDTPRDVLCAKHAGMKSVAVTTGKFSATELAAQEPDLILENLSNPEIWFDRLINPVVTTSSRK